MKRFKIDIKVNGKLVPNTIVFDEKSTLTSCSPEYLKDLIQQTINPEQNIGSLDFKVVELGDVGEVEEKKEPEKQIDAATLSLFNPG